MSKQKRRDIPQFKTPIIETHCHLDYLDQAHLDSILEKSRHVGIERIITIAVSAGNLQRVMKLATSCADIWGTQGIHPHEAESYSAEIDTTIRKNAMHAKILAVGEIGLDYYYDHADRAAQRSVFEQQLQTAAELDLPVVIHTREADDDMRDILKSHSACLARKGVIHSFTSSLALAEFCLAEGFVLGFNGITTFNSADNVRKVVAATPLDRLLLETDAPYLTPVPYRGKPNAPYYLPFVAETLAAIKEVDVEDLLQQAYRNSLEVFFSGAKGPQAIKPQH
ncbi:MAG: TatD family hydrolase [Halioglobus sp.]|nr:TatD family hydrolase [Halioglobus sp.]